MIQWPLCSNCMLTKRLFKYHLVVRFVYLFIHKMLFLQYDPVTHKRFEISDEDYSGHTTTGTSDWQTNSVERIASDSLLKVILAIDSVYI